MLERLLNATLRFSIARRHSAVMASAFVWQAMAAAIYLGLMGGGIAVAIAASIVLRGIKLI